MHDPKYPHTEVYGSIAEIEEAFGVEVKDLHRPFIDTLTKKNPKDPTGKSMMRRVTDVLDCWFESGSMPYAQAHYPFENKEWFESHFPADFIVEYVAQTRGWFYTLMILSTALFDKPPFKNCICHGVIIGEGNQKLSKRLKNYADPKEVFETLGADAMRWFMISSPVMHGQELVVDKDGSGIREVARLVMKPIWNAYNFFTLYANADGIKAEFDITSHNIMDKYIISKCIETISEIKRGMDAYDTIIATNATESFFEVLNNWYIRRSRERFWKTEKDNDKLSAYNTLYSVLHLMCRAIAPLLPMLSEEIFLGLTSASDNQQSVHLEKFPDTNNQQPDHELIRAMERVRDACNSALSIRNESNVKIRQPLGRVTFIGVADGFIDEFKQLILDEINAKSWENLDRDSVSKYANLKLGINFSVLGKRIPRKVKEIIQANKSGDWKFEDGKVTIAEEILEENEFSINLEPKEEYKSVMQALSSNDALVFLDLNITEDLKLEGIARDLVRSIQQTRKEAGLEITDRITLRISSDSDLIMKSIAKWENYIKEQVLAVEINGAVFSDALTDKNVVLEYGEIRFELARG